MESWSASFSKHPGKVDASALPVTVLSETLLSQGGAETLGEDTGIFEAVVEIAGRQRRVALKKFVDQEWARQSFEKFHLIKQAQLPTWFTYRLAKDNKHSHVVLMSLGNDGGAGGRVLSLNINNMPSIHPDEPRWDFRPDSPDATQSYIEKIHITPENIEQLLHTAQECILWGTKNGYQITENVYMLGYDPERSDNAVSIWLGDFDGVMHRPQFQQTDALRRTNLNRVKLFFEFIERHYIREQDALNLPALIESKFPDLSEEDIYSSHITSAHMEVGAPHEAEDAPAGE